MDGMRGGGRGEGRRVKSSFTNLFRSANVFRKWKNFQSGAFNFSVELYAKKKYNIEYVILMFCAQYT